jgi:predicted RNase H-like HicB family nuclease
MLAKAIRNPESCRFADVPDLEACSAFGATAEEALREVQIAKQAWLDAARAAGKPVPQPHHRPVVPWVAS